jgi:hypothetical protein
VFEPNKGKTRDSRRTIVDVEIARIDVELGKCSAAWVNPFFVVEEDRKFLCIEKSKGD